MVAFLTCSPVLFAHNVSMVGGNTHLSCILICIWDAVRLHFRPGSLSMLPVPGIQTRISNESPLWDILGVRCAFLNISFRLFAHLTTN